MQSKKIYSLSTEKGRYQLANIEEEKYIKVVEDSKLKFHKQITEKVKKSNQTVCIIKRNILDEKKICFFISHW